MNKDFINRYSSGERYFLNVELGVDDTLENLNLDNATFENCTIASSFVGASLASAKFISSNLKTSDFSNCIFEDTIFENCSLEATMFTGTLNRVHFIGCHCYGQEVELDTETEELVPLQHPNVKLLYTNIPLFDEASDHESDDADYLVYGQLSTMLAEDIIKHEHVSTFTQNCFNFFNMIGDKNDREIDNLLVVGVYEELYSNKKCNETAIALLQGRNREVYIYWMHNGFITVDI